MTVLQFPDAGRKALASVRYETIKEYPKAENGQQIVLCRGSAQIADEQNSYAVLFICPVGLPDSFDIIAEFKHTEIGRQSAEMAADVADRTLGCAYVYLPEGD